MTTLVKLIAEAGLTPLTADTIAKFDIYLELLLKWNDKLNLTAIRRADEILSRHFVECVFCAQNLPPGIRTLLDFGSGAGFPGLPIALCRPEIAVTLAECQIKKASFLREAVRATGVTAAVHAGRAETLTTLFDCVVLRAVDKMPQAALEAQKLVSAGGTLILLVGTNVNAESALPELLWAEPLPIPNSHHTVMLTGRIAASFHVEQSL